MKSTVIWEKIIKSEYKTIGVIGMAKNAGKTVTLNAIIKFFDMRKTPVGVISIGRDGESEDVLTKTPKPRITLFAGMLFATGEALLDPAMLSYQIIEKTNVETYFGNMTICRALDEGTVEISGANTHTSHKYLMDRLQVHGATHVLVDGAMDRQTIASPALLDAVILATGAVLSRTMGKVVNLTEVRIEQFSCKLVDVPLLGQLQAALSDHAVVLIDGADDINSDTRDTPFDQYSIRPIGTLNTALNAGKVVADKIEQTTKGVCIKGALTKGIVNDIVKSLQVDRSFFLVVMDSTKLYLDRESWLGLKAQKISVYVLEKTNLIAVTVNPSSPQGHTFDSEMLCEAMREKTCLPVVDVLNTNGKTEMNL